MIIIMITIKKRIICYVREKQGVRFRRAREGRPDADNSNDNNNDDDNINDNDYNNNDDMNDMNHNNNNSNNSKRFQAVLPQRRSANVSISVPPSSAHTRSPAQSVLKYNNWAITLIVYIDAIPLVILYISCNLVMHNTQSI